MEIVVKSDNPEWTMKAFVDPAGIGDAVWGWDDGGEWVVNKRAGLAAWAEGNEVHLQVK